MPLNLFSVFQLILVSPIILLSLQQSPHYIRSCWLIIISICADGKEINRCTGIVVGRDEVKKSVTVLTSAWIICTEKPINDWLDKKYALQAKVTYFSRHLAVAYHVMTDITSFIFVIPL
jgi:hypothetical protein